MSQQALDIIREVKAKRLPRLDLGNCGLTELPPEALECAWVEELILSSWWIEFNVEEQDLVEQTSQNNGEDNQIARLPQNLSNLSSLKKLVINNNPISDLSPLAQLPNLQQLSCSETQVSDLSPLAPLLNLQQLSCSETQVSDLSPLAPLLNLQQLSCSETQVSDLSPLAPLLNLQQLSCSETQVSDLSPLAPLLNLQELDCSSTQVSNLLPLAPLVNLQTLFCSSAQVSDLSPLAQLINLQTLDCSSTQVSDLSPLAQLVNLQTLICSSTQVSNLSPLAQLVNLQTLICSSAQVSDLSPLAQLINLQTLNCSSPQVSDLSPLAQLINLQTLNCSSPQVSDLSPLAQLINLQTLICSETQVGDLSPLAPLVNLQTIFCSSTPISDLSPLAPLLNLQQLDCSSTQLSDLSPLAQLVNLQTLNCSSTQVSDLSPLAPLLNLQQLDCSSTQLSDLSPLVGLVNLRTLDCSSTKISDLSPLAGLVNLRALDCSSTKISDLSPLKSIMEKGVSVKWDKWGIMGIFVKGCPLDKALIASIKKGPEAVLKYFNKPKVRLFEARVLVLGEPRAGKTTLRRKLKSTNAEMPKPTESTKAFEIEVAPYACKIEHEGEAKKMTYYLWDFGGQDYYRLLHQLFVAEQSVYLIVTGTDANKHEEELDFWLETIQRLGRDEKGNYGPVILLQNPQNKREDLNFQELKKRYPFWKQSEQFVVNLNAIGQDKPNAEVKTFDKKELERFQHFKAYLEKSFCQIEHIGKEMPADWVRIKKELDKKKAKHWISKEDFRTLCAAKGIKNAAEQDDLLGIFRTLGFLFHYNTKALEGMVILESEWVTDALYRVLDDKIVAKNKGWFLESDVKTIWHEIKYRDRTQALLDLMQEFKLSYLNEASRRYIVPAKLPYDTEGLPDWDERNNVHLRLQYDWLPRAIATQLMVSLHKDLVALPDDKQWIWRKGAVLDGRHYDLKDVQVRIEDFWKENRIDISARGESSEALIRIVLQKWREVNAPFENKVVVTKVILCPCSVCKTAKEPHKFKYESVLNAKEMGRNLQCNESLQEFAAADILKGIFDETTVVLDTFQKKTGKTDGLFFELIAAGEEAKALDMLPKDDHTSIDLKRRYADLKQREGRNLLSYQKYQREMSKIVLDMLAAWEQDIPFHRGGKRADRLGEPDIRSPRKEVVTQVTNITNYGQLNMAGHSENITYSPNLGIPQADFDALKQAIAELSAAKRAELQQEIASTPEPVGEAEKTSVAKRVLNWFNNNSKDIVVEVVSAAYYDVIKTFLGV